MDEDELDVLHAEDDLVGDVVELLVEVDPAITLVFFLGLFELFLKFSQRYYL